MSRIVRVALIQARHEVHGDETVKKHKDAAIEKHLKLIKEAADKKAQIVCLQEIFYGPYFCAEQNIKWYEATEKIPDGPTTKLMQEQAKKYGMVIVVPMYEEDITGVYFNTAAVIDAGGEYLGGASAPGMVGALESLTRGAAQLYQVEMIAPPKPIGTNTVKTMQSGLVLGYAGLVEGLVKRLKEAMLRSNPSDTFKVIATGGLADVVKPETDAIDVVDQQLTLKGLRLIYELNNPTP